MNRYDDFATEKSVNGYYEHAQDMTLPAINRVYLIKAKEEDLHSMVRIISAFWLHLSGYGLYLTALFQLFKLQIM